MWKVAQDLKHKHYIGRTVSIKLRFADYQTITRNLTLSEYTDDATNILAAARECLRRVVIQKKIRLLGIRVSSLYFLSDKNTIPIESTQKQLPFDIT